MCSTSTQIVLIAGANQGIGYLTALQLSKLSGYHILVGTRNAEKGAEAVTKIEAEGPRSEVEHVLINVDLDDSIFAAIKHVQTKFGRLDILVMRLP
jgi:NAD(P)-dependent dehydrogenase (short-subunit alcohol dehydrogenase family)